jgi:hypothetical protein
MRQPQDATTRPTLTKAPNPQGKGLRPVLDALTEFKKGEVAAPKHISQISAELFTSLLILGSQLRFKPVLEHPYWLYKQAGHFQLSLIHPAQWRSEQSGEYIGECRLHSDLTWSLHLADTASNNPTLQQDIQRRQHAFEQQLLTTEHLQSALPVYVAEFSFYSRVLAAGLAHSLGASMQQTGIAQLNYSKAMQVQNVSRATQHKPLPHPPTATRKVLTLFSTTPQTGQFHTLR